MATMNTNNISWKLVTTKGELDHHLELGQDIEITIKGSVIQKITGDNQDGTENVKYVIKAITSELF